jgi:hypothetical protein
MTLLDLMKNFGTQTVNGYQVPGNPSPALPAWYESPKKRHKSYPDYYTKTIGNEWTPAPFAEGAPENVMDFYNKYRYNSNGAGTFESPLNPEYIQVLWNEINQQAPDLSNNNKLAFLETMLSMTHLESHGGYDAGWQPRKTNVWNMGYNGKNPSLSYDPESIQEMADFEVERAMNRFGMLKNKGMSDEALRLYTPDMSPEDYRKYMNTWHTITGIRTPWE